VRTVYSPDTQIATWAMFRSADQMHELYEAMEKANLALIDRLPK
jgi:hypothetical protein